jgi:hypothetical protein
MTHSSTPMLPIGQPARSSQLPTMMIRLTDWPH